MLTIGTDIIECERIGQMLAKHGKHFVERVFTEGEIRYCSDRRNAQQHFAGRWAAKEAVLKALGTGWVAGITWTDVEVVNEASGAPFIRLHNGAAEVAAEKGIAEILVSISHCKDYATAVAAGIP
jgi:holo-[acyl-carrier protein] synthase